MSQIWTSNMYVNLVSPCPFPGSQLWKNKNIKVAFNLYPLYSFFLYITPHLPSTDSPLCSNLYNIVCVSCVVLFNRWFCVKFFTFLHSLHYILYQSSHFFIAHFSFYSLLHTFSCTNRSRGLLLLPNLLDNDNKSSCEHQNMSDPLATETHSADDNDKTESASQVWSVLQQICYTLNPRWIITLKELKHFWCLCSSWLR